METLAKRFYVSGVVQGVGYRFFVERTAERLGVAGFVKNRADGRVEVYAIGNGSQLETLRNELQRGPRMSSVTGISENDESVLQQYASFFTIETDD